MADLPLTLDSFVGRDWDIAEVSKLLGGPRLVTITGPPGVGKTRLAVEVATRLQRTYADGVWLVPLAGVGDDAAVPAAVAGALGVHESGGKGIEESLVSHLRQRQVLLVIDNAEHLLGACRRLVDRLMRACAEVSVLVTSRQRLGVDGEQVFGTEPLGVEAHEGVGDDLAPALRLFIDRARAVRPRFALHEDSRREVTEICRHLDGLPLAIELAAARVDSLSVGDIAGRLDERLDVLVKEPTASDTRHRNLRAALEWSYALLSADEQRLLRRLSAFAGSFDAAAASAVAVAVGQGGSDGRIVPTLSSLVSKSLVVAETSGATARYRLLGTVAAFGAERLDEAGESSDTAARHSAWFVLIAEGAENRLTGPDQLEALVDLDLAYLDMLAALQRALDAGRHEEALRVAGGLSLYWRLRGRYSEARQWLEAALAGVGSAQVQPSLHATALWGAGFGALMVGDSSRAVETLEAALALARETGDHRREARTLLLLGNNEMVGDLDAAVGYLTASHDIALGIADTWCAAHAMALFGRMKLDAGDLAGARVALERAVATARDASDPQSLRISVSVLGQLCMVQGRLKEAEALFAETREVAASLNDPYFGMRALEGLARVSLQRGRPEAAEDFIDRAGGCVPELTWRDLLEHMALRAEIARFRGNHIEATAQFRQIATLLREAGQPAESVLAALAQELIGQREYADARSTLEEAQESLAGQDWPAARAEVLRFLGELDAVEGRPDNATTRYQEALRLQHQVGSAEGIAATLQSLVEVAIKKRRHSYAARILAASDAIRRACGFVVSTESQKAAAAHRLALSKALGQEKFESLWGEGSAMSVDEAVAYAVRRRGSPDPEEPGWTGLTKKERKVVSLVAEGLTNAEVAASLFVSRRTVDAHLANVFAKLGIKSRTQLARMAHAQGQKNTPNLGNFA